MTTIYNTEDTITALSTSPGKGAIGIIRISGKETYKILKKIFIPYNKKITLQKPGRYLGKIVNKGRVIDEVLLLTYKAPKSYTGEDLIEIHCHGNMLIVNMILNLLSSFGARPAGPGEFTLRAFLNNKLNLSQAEAINDLINANTYFSVEIALKNLDNHLSNYLNDIMIYLKELVVTFEVSIDHSEDEEKSFLDLMEIKKNLTKIIQKLKLLILSYEKGRLLRQGLNVVLLGKANVGKSSLFNLLIKRDKAIISPLPGTTRDVVEEYIEIDGYPIKIIDTAGFKNESDLIEKEALKRTFNSITTASILLVLFDNSSKFDENDILVIENVKKANSPFILILNKCDLKTRMDLKKIKKYFPKENIYKISVSRETGIKNVENALKNLLKKFDFVNEIIITNLRHKNILQETKFFLEKMIEGIEQNLYYDAIVSDLRKAINTLGQLTGEYTSENILEDIFSHFCIGK